MVSSLQTTKIQTFIGIDQAPTLYSHNWNHFFSAMKSTSFLSDKKELERRMNEIIPDQGQKLYLMQNLAFNGQHFEWRLNWEGLEKEQRRVFEFPGKKELLERGAADVFWNPVLFLGGLKSDRLVGREEEVLKFFPKSVFNYVDGGHFFHAEKPTLTFGLVDAFLKEFGFLGNASF